MEQPKGFKADIEKFWVFLCCQNPLSAERDPVQEDECRENIDLHYSLFVINHHIQNLFGSLSMLIIEKKEDVTP